MLGDMGLGGVGGRSAKASCLWLYIAEVVVRMRMVMMA